ncbi:DUF1643 domain-containing protein [Cognatishimia sp. WU-CL00825]|uniref:DUF1643 domain-containing protein n=1 Tax=Cognatishimia sp. WU-CL00825 TaxID=3127658 RepID=UPI0031080CEC
MIKRKFQKGDAASEAWYSDCETYRYSLTRIWDNKKPRVAFVMLNPSKATEIQNDPTIERCERRARILGFGGFRAVNIFALRETSPRLMRQHKSPEGPENKQVLRDSCGWAQKIIAAWGVHGAHLDQGKATCSLLLEAGKEVYHLGLTKDGHPRHPLYIRYAQQPEPWPINPLKTGDL